MLTTLAQYIFAAIMFLLFPAGPPLEGPQFTPKQKYPLQFAMILEESAIEEGIGHGETKFHRA